ncbi:MAG TPA: LamG-like jellyroll fold domain-containing protein [Phycisphaerales bacterium]|nr:LamG-like jellyroll fold domain-containing protein [Phycisphaerales bacterium]
MAESATVRMATLAGGISKLKAEVRSAGQVEDASNADFSLQHGFAKRAGTSHIAALGSSIASTVWLESRTLEGGERPRVLIGSDGTVRVFDGATEATVQIDLAVASYLATSHARRPVSASVDDDEGVLRIANPAVIPLAESSPTVTSSGHRDTYAALESFTPTAAGQVWRAKEGSDARPAGLYRYTPGIGTFARARFATYNASNSNTSQTALLCSRAQNPRGFKIFVSRFIADGSATYAISTGGPHGDQGTVTGAILDGYTYQEGDQLYYSAGGGGVAGAYPIASSSAGFGSGLTLEGVITGAAAGAITIRGIGRLVEINENFHTDPVTTMDDAAVRITQSLRAAGLVDACCHWEWDTFDTYEGHFVITSPWGGPKAGFCPTNTFITFAPSTGNYNDSAATAAFNAPTITAGTGAFEDFTTPARDRWTPVPTPDQADAVLDPETMPVRLRQIVTGGYDDTALDLGAWHYFRLGDSTLNNSAKDSTGHSLGTYSGSPTRGGGNGLVVGDSNDATVFDGTNDTVTATTWWSMGNRAAVTVEALVVTTNAVATEKCFVHLRQKNDLYVTMNKTQANRITVYAGGGEYRCDVANFNDGNLKHLTVVCRDETATAGARITVYVNGVAQTMTATAEVATPPSIATEQGGYTITIGSRQNAATPQYFAGTLDEVAIYPFALNQAAITFRSAQAGNTHTGDLWAVEHGAYAARLTGDQTTNPVPSFVKNGVGISAMTVWQGRDEFGAGRSVTLGRANEGTSFFVKDADNVTDGDPIDRVVVQEGNITSLTTFGSICVATTDGPVQYELSAGKALTISSLNSRAGYRQRVAAVAPVLSGDRLYVAAPTSEGSTVTGTLLEGIIDEQSVAATYDDVGQGVRGLVNPTSLDSAVLVTVASDGKLILCEKGGSRLWVYQTAYIGQEKRQSAWTQWTLGTGVIRAACDEGEAVLLVVERSGKYTLESWRPEPPEQWPTSAQRIDGRVSVASVSHGAGVTTFTMPTNVPATGIDTAVKSDGTVLTATPISATQFTVPGLLHPITVTAGRSYAATARLSRPFQRDLNGQAYIGQSLTLSHLMLTATDLSRVTATVTVDSRAGTVWPVRSINSDTKLGRAWTRGPVQRTSIDLTLTGTQPISVGTAEQVVDAVRGRV